MWVWPKLVVAHDFLDALANLGRSYLEKDPNGPPILSSRGHRQSVSQGVCTGHGREGHKLPRAKYGRVRLQHSSCLGEATHQVPEVGEVRVDPTSVSLQHQTQMVACLSPLAGLPGGLRATWGLLQEFCGPRSTSTPAVTFLYQSIC